MRPNIIFIVADDLGFADLGCYGGRPAGFGPVSPHLDALAANGLRFTEGYSNSPVCSPTRFALMTMRYQYRLRGGMEEPINSRSKGNPKLGLPPEIPTLPSLLRDAGYATALIGKWHLGYPPACGPQRSGYDDFYGIMAGGVDYFSHRSGKGDHDLYEGEDERHDVGYLTDLLSQRAVDHVRERAAAARDGKPFLLSLHYTAPHWPWETRDDAHLAEQVADNLFHLDGGNVETYRRMVHHMDEGIGQLVAALRAEGLLDDTLIVFTSDNGGERFSDNWPLVGGKMDLTEGGIRVPWIAHWPAAIPAGTTSAQHCMSMDWSATLLDIGGGQPHPGYPVDGVSLAAVLRQPAQAFARPLYWRMNHRHQRALRQGDWKYLQVDGHEYLFNLAQDARERANLAHKHPDTLAALRADWLAWEATVPAIPDDASVSLGYSAKDMPQR
jgi:arylsulfatase A-like enzyme